MGGATLRIFRQKDWEVLLDLHPRPALSALPPWDVVTAVVNFVLRSHEIPDVIEIRRGWFGGKSVARRTAFNPASVESVYRTSRHAAVKATVLFFTDADADLIASFLVDGGYDEISSSEQEAYADAFWAPYLTAEDLRPTSAGSVFCFSHDAAEAFVFG